jgi:hypothetical protein
VISLYLPLVAEVIYFPDTKVLEITLIEMDKLLPGWNFSGEMYIRYNVVP